MCTVLAVFIGEGGENGGKRSLHNVSLEYCTGVMAGILQVHRTHLEVVLHA